MLLEHISLGNDQLVCFGNQTLSARLLVTPRFSGLAAKELSNKNPPRLPGGVHLTSGEIYNLDPVGVFTQKVGFQTLQFSGFLIDSMN
jgi:hypothetical protein